jgi:hypothetical protein
MAFWKFGPLLLSNFDMSITLSYTIRCLHPFLLLLPPPSSSFLFFSPLPQPVFVLSVDTPEPTYLLGLKQAAAFGESVYIVQNNQQRVDTQMKCASLAPATAGESAHHLTRAQSNGRNPLRAALAATAEAIGGMPGSHAGHRGLPTAPSLIAALSGRGTGTGSGRDSTRAHFDEREILELHNSVASTSAELYRARDQLPEGASSLLKDWSSFLGASPSFEAAEFASKLIPRFSSLELVS